jgi:hypothetical protein
MAQYGQRMVKEAPMAEEMKTPGDDPYPYMAVFGAILACYGGWYWYSGQPIDAQGLSAAGAGLFLLALGSMIWRGWRRRRGNR